MIRSRSNVSNCGAVDQNVQQVVDNDDEPAGHPGRRIGSKSGRLALGPRPASGPGPVLEPSDVTGQVPAIEDKMRPPDNSNRIRVQRNEKKRQNVKDAVYESGKRAFRFLASHPLTLQQVVAYPVSN